MLNFGLFFCPSQPAAAAGPDEFLRMLRLFKLQFLKGKLSCYKGITQFSHSTSSWTK